jgi:hypothetical protein
VPECQDVHRIDGRLVAVQGHVAGIPERDHQLAQLGHVWSKRPLRLSLPGWRAALVAAPLAVSLIIVGLLSWFLLALWLSDLPVRALTQWTILVGIVAGILAWICHPFHVLINDRIVRAPTFLEATLPLGHVLVLRREGADRVLRMVRYTAKCPICAGDITIEKGRRQHRGRLVGECGRNPVEHVFSFDFITGKGARLR